MTQETLSDIFNMRIRTTEQTYDNINWTKHDMIGQILQCREDVREAVKKLQLRIAELSPNAKWTIEQVNKEIKATFGKELCE